MPRKLATTVTPRAQETPQGASSASVSRGSRGGRPRGRGPRGGGTRGGGVRGGSGLGRQTESLTSSSAVPAAASNRNTTARRDPRASSLPNRTLHADNHSGTTQSSSHSHSQVPGNNYVRQGLYRRDVRRGSEDASTTSDKTALSSLSSIDGEPSRSITPGDQHSFETTYTDGQFMPEHGHHHLGDLTLPVFREHDSGSHVLAAAGRPRRTSTNGSRDQESETGEEPFKEAFEEDYSEDSIGASWGALERVLIPNVIKPVNTDGMSPELHGANHDDGYMSTPQASPEPSGRHDAKGGPKSPIRTKHPRDPSPVVDVDSTKRRSQRRRK